MLSLVLPCSAIKDLERVTLLLWDSVPCELRVILRWFLGIVPTLERPLAGTVERIIIDLYGWERLVSQSPKHRLYSKNNIMDKTLGKSCVMSLLQR